MDLPVNAHLYGMYLVTMVAMSLSPGPANLFAAAIGLSEGRRAALHAVIGMNAVTLMWYMSAAFGLIAVLHAFPQMQMTLSVAGVAYLGWLSVSLIRDGLSGQSLRLAPAVTARSAFMSGAAVQLSNPKAIMFFAVVLPSFIDPNRPLVPQLVLFAAATLTLDMLTMGAFGMAGAMLSRKFSDLAFRQRFLVCAGLLMLVVATLLSFAILTVARAAPHG